MATKVTYLSALTTIKQFATDNGFDDADVLAKIDALIAQKSPKGNNGKKSPVRKANENLARDIIAAMKSHNADDIEAAWVKNNVDGINSPAKAVAVLNVANDMGLLVCKRVEVSATRSKLVYSLPTEQSMEFGESPQNPHTFSY